ncbi:hypothetical protein BH10PLA2_BH10PLA2_37010 [soil metagenome]
MRRSNVLFLASLLFAAACGCRSNSDLVEAELRTRNEDLRTARSELAKAEFMNDALAREVTVLRQQGPAKLTTEQAASTTTLKEIVLTRQTGGYDQDRQPGDDALMVAFEPKDGDGHAVKAPGSLEVTAQEVSKEGIKTMLSVWNVSPEELRRSWQDGFFSKGYQIALPWKTCPTSDHLRVTARFYLADGRAFEADRDVTVRLPPAGQRKDGPAPLMIEMPQAPMMNAPAKLPMPRTTESNKPKAEDMPWWKQTPSPTAPAASAPTTAPAVEEVHWRPKAQPPLSDAVELGKPKPITQRFPIYQQ